MPGETGKTAMIHAGGRFAQRYQEPYPMQNDTQLKIQEMRALVDSLGPVDAARFIALIQKREPFDYTVWQENLLADLSIEEISKRAAELRKNQTAG